MASLEPKKLAISISDAQITDLKDRLARTRLPDQLEGVQWEYGMSKEYLKELLEYWAESFDWRKQEQYLNSFNNYILEANGIEMHFIHERSPHANAIPLLLLHGWPGSYFEFHKIAKRLANPEASTNGSKPVAFHVVAPSLPGYGFSSAPKQPGFGIKEVVATVNELMIKLNYKRYVAQGGDWGGIAVYALGALHTENVAAIHSNMAIATPSYFSPWHMLQAANAMVPILNKLPVFLSSAEMKGLEGLSIYRTQESGYFEIQRTKPQSLGYALNDSPAGLAAWIVEKFWRWSDCGGDVESKFTKDELLTNVSLYWFNESITSSMRLYREASSQFGELLRLRVKAPSAVAIFPKEIASYPKNWVAAKYNLKQWSTFKSGGHFAALEEPEALLQDIRSFFSKWH